MKFHPVPQRHRRWPGVILAVVVLCCVATGFYLLERQHADQRLRRSVKLSESIDGNVVSAKILTGELSARQLEYLRQYPGLKSLDLSGRAFLAGQLSSLRMLPALTSLDLSRSTHLDETVLSDIAGLPNISSLQFTGSELSDSPLARLAGHPALKILSLTRCRGISDQSIDTLIALPSLEWVALTETKISLEGFTRLRNARTDLTITYAADSRLTGVELDDLTEGPSADEQALLRLQSSGSTADIAALLAVPHNWATGRWAPEGVLEQIRSVTLSGPSAAESMAWLAPRLSKLTALNVPGAALMSASPEQLAGVRSAVLSDVTSAEQLHQVNRLPALEALTIHVVGPVIDDDGDREHRLPRLVRLSLMGPGVNDAVVRLFSRSTAPEALHLELTAPLSTSCLETPGQWRGLRRITLYGPGVDEALVGALGKFQELVSLDMNLAQPVDPDALLPLAGLPHLEAVTLEGAGVSDRMMESLSKLPALKSVSLTAAPVSDAGISLLLDRPHPPRILVQQTQVSSQMLQRLAENLQRR